MRLMGIGRTMKPGLHMRITSIVCASPEHTGNSKGSRAPRIVFLRGTVLSSDSADIPFGPISALFRLGEHDASTGRKPLSLAEGRDVHVWRPWSCMSCAAHDSDDREEGSGNTELVWCFLRFNVFEPKIRAPRPFPMPSPLS